MLKNVLLLLVSSVVCLLLLEVGAARLYSAYTKSGFSKPEVRSRLLAEDSALGAGDTDLAGEVERLKGANVPDQPVILHPYFGFVVNPERRGINRYGFFRDDPLTKRSAENAVVIIFGGSVADQFFTMGEETLVRELQARGVFADRSVQLLSTALGGYKQPQQLLILAYFLALGAEYDVVINVDGFNEVDGANDNILDGVNPFFPHNWNLHARQGLAPEAMVHLGQVELIRQNRARLRDLFSNRILRSSAFFLTLWDFLDRRQEGQMRAQMRALQTFLSSSKLPPRVRGPELSFADDGQRYAALADVWQRSSLEMARLCRESGIRYFHVLQPNQYLPGSKTLSEEEREIAWDRDVADTKRVETGYPMLIERGRELRELGVPFIDLTMLFENETGTIYNDTCCHVNQRGADLMAESVAAAIAATY
jgi:hypothetical protein